MIHALRLVFFRGSTPGCLAAVLLAALGCGGEPSSPEEQIRALVHSAQAAANDQDSQALRALVSESYRDARGLTKADIDQILRGQFLRGRAYVLVRVQELRVADATQAQVRVLAGMARVPVGGFDELLASSADVFLFDFELNARTGGAWQVVSARWRRATSEDLEL